MSNPLKEEEHGPAHTFCLVIDHEPAAHASSPYQCLPLPVLVRARGAHLKYSFVASSSPSCPNTEKRIPFGCVLSTSSQRQTMSRSGSYAMRCAPPSMRVLFTMMLA